MMEDRSDLNRLENWAISLSLSLSHTHTNTHTHTHRERERERERNSIMKNVKCCTYAGKIRYRIIALVKDS